MNYKQYRPPTTNVVESLGRKYNNIYVNDNIAIHNIRFYHHIIAGHMIKFDILLNMEANGKINIKNNYVSMESDGFVRWRGSRKTFEWDPIFYGLIMDAFKKQPYFDAVGGSRKLSKID